MRFALGHDGFLRMIVFFVIASVATCPPKLNERRRKQSMLASEMDCFVAAPDDKLRETIQSRQ